MEVCLIACYPSSPKCKTFFDQNPTKRHNHITHAPLRVLTKDRAGNVVNPTEKPPGVWDQFLHNYVAPGQKVMVLGAGAGGDLRAVIARGISCYAIEKDRAQFDFLCSMLESWDAKLSVQEAKEAAALKKKEANAEYTAPIFTCAICDIKYAAVKMAQCSACEEMICTQACSVGEGDALQCKGCLPVAEDADSPPA